MTQQQWRAAVTYAGAPAPITEVQADALMAALPGYGIAVHDGERLTLELTVAASTLRRAADEALKAVQAAYADVFDVVGSAVAIRVVTEEDHQREIAHPPAVELVSAAEIADMLGVSRQRVHQLAEEHADFPAPVAQLKTGAVRTRKSVEAFIQRWPRLAGWAGKHAAASKTSERAGSAGRSD